MNTQLQKCTITTSFYHISMLVVSTTSSSYHICRSYSITRRCWTHPSSYSFFAPRGRSRPRTSKYLAGKMYSCNSLLAHAIFLWLWHSSRWVLKNAIGTQLLNFFCSWLFSTNFCLTTLVLSFQICYTLDINHVIVSAKFYNFVWKLQACYV